MTEIEASSLVSLPGRANADPDSAPAPLPEPAPRSLTRRIVRVTLRRWGARLGLMWIGLMVLLAVFAPVLANSHPIVLKQEGEWSSPLLEYLTPADVTLQAALWTGIVLVLLRKRVRTKLRVLIFFAIVAVVATLSILFVHPPSPITYHTYRIDAQAGLVEKAIYAPIPYSPNDHLFEQRRMRLREPSSTHLMGTTDDAADLLTNMIYATRIALSIGFVATGVAIVLGVLMGGAMGYFRGWVDLLGMRVVEIFESIPTLLLLLVFAGMFKSSGELGLYIMMAAIGFVNSFSYAEFIRAEFLTLRDRDFVLAARAAGLPVRSILFRHLLPNGITPVIVNASFGVAGAILAESTLSYLNIGLRGEASWGTLLSQATKGGGQFHWWLAIYPGMAIFLTVFSYNLIGEALRDALDPRLIENS